MLPMKDTLTVARLIELLQALPDEQKAYAVHGEGCDCTQPATGIGVMNERDAPLGGGGYVIVGYSYND